MLLFSNATLQRFAKTIQPVQIVSTESQLSSELQDIIAKTKEAEENKKPEVPPASDVTVGKSGVATPSGGFTTVLTDEQLRKLTSEQIAISTISGTFLIQKAYALDISFTTRFQAEWPRNWNAFLSSPVFGTGYSSLTLATDNDYLRALGETGLAGLLSFLLVFVVLGIFMKNTVGLVKDQVTRAFMFGLAGGMIGLLVNALLIDVFEASKVAEPMWMLLGIGVGAGYLYKKHPINYKKELREFFTSRVMLLFYLLLLILITYIGSISNFFVADDFTWLRWAATSELSDIPMYFINAQDFFYRPLDKTIVYVLYQIFAFVPEGYHLFTLLIHFVTVVGVFFLATKILNNRLLSFLTAVVFALHPVHHENIYWFSTLSVTLSSLFIVYTVLAYIRFREKRSVFAYGAAIVLSILAFLAYEMSVVIPLLLITVDIFLIKPKRNKKLFVTYLPFILMVPFYFIIRSASNAFTSGGDYSYNVLYLPFNVVGNYVGYLALFLGGNALLPFYTAFRDNLSELTLLAAIILIIVCILVAVMVYRWRKKLAHIGKNQYIVLLCFGLVFAAISLLPFLGLGNIAPRYFYLASFGFALAFIVLLQYVVSLSRVLRKYVTVLLVILITLLSFWYYKENISIAKEWRTAGEITKDTLRVFRIDYEGFSSSTQVYFVDMPLKYHDVWLFPIGLNDALWFIYRERLPQIYHVGTVKEAKTKIRERKKEESYIFRFDKGRKVVREE
jgi:hypothetical protein